MDNTVSRKLHRIAYLIIFAAIPLMFLGISPSLRWLLWIGTVVYVIGAVMMVNVDRCPHCKEHFRGFYWSKSVGFCSQCGEKILFDDENEDESDGE